MLEEGTQNSSNEKTRDNSTERQSEIAPRPEDPEIQVIQEQVLERMQRREILQVIRYEDGKLSHVVLDNMQALVSGYPKENGEWVKRKDYLKVDAPELRNRMPGISPSEMIYWTFKGIPVITTAEVESQEDITPKNLLYIPSEQYAFKRESMKSAEGNHYLRMWDMGRGWNDPHPTVESDFATNITVLDIAVPYEIYVTGNGERTDDGTLMVDKNPGIPNGMRQPISGKWFSDNFFAGGPKGNGPSIDNPHDFMQERGVQWELHGLLKDGDFPTRNQAKEEFSATQEGYFYINNKRFTLGVEFSRCTVKRLSPSEYGAYQANSDEPLIVFKDEILPEGVRNCSLQKFENNKGGLRNVILLPQGSFPTSMSSEYGSVFLKRYREDGKTRERVSLRREVPLLHLFKESLPGGIQEQFEQLSLLNQISLTRQISELPSDKKTQALDLLHTGGIGYLKLLADTYKEGNFDNRVLDILNKSPDVMKKVFDSYESYTYAAEGLVNTLETYLGESQVLTDIDRIYLERVNQSFISRGQDLVILAAEKSNEIDEATELARLTEALLGITHAITTEENVQYTKGISTSNELTSITKTARLKGNTRASIVIRPNDVPRHEDRRFDQGQSRIGFIYTNNSGEKIRLAIDKDEYGISVDMGSRGDRVTESLARIGKSHHTQTHFEEALDNPQYFGSFASKLPQAVGWPTHF